MKMKWGFYKTGKCILVIVLIIAMVSTTLLPVQAVNAAVKTDSVKAEKNKNKKIIIKKVTISNKNPGVGEVLTAAVEPEGAEVTYSWSINHKEVSRDKEYPVIYANKGKEIELKVKGTGDTVGCKSDKTKKVTSDKEYTAKNPYERYEAENFDGSFGPGMVTEDCSDGGKNIGGIKDGFYTYYRNVDFGAKGAKSIIVRASSGTNGGTLEIRLGSPTGKLAGSCEILPTGSWSTYRTYYAEIGNITGVQDIYLVFTGNDYLFNLNWIQFFGKPSLAITGVAIDNLNPVVGDTLHGTVTPGDALVKYIWKADGTVKGYDADYTVTVSDIGKQIELEVTGIGNYMGVVTSDKTSVVKAMDYNLDFEKVAYDGFTAFIDKYYTYDAEDNVYRFEKGFWTEAEMYEIVIDAYNHTGDPRYKDMIDKLYEGFLVDWKGQEKDGWWSGNDYNDDIMWMVIACARAYMATGDVKYLNTARLNFDQTYARAWSEDLGGGLWWRVDNQTKNACVNGPGAIAACLLGGSLKDESYFEKAKAIMEWERANLYEPDTGHVYDSYNIQGEKNMWASTYNQGTFIGANTLLYEHFGDEQYLNDAVMAANYAMSTMYNNGVMSNEESGGDLPGFKGILTRWLNYLIVNHNQPQFAEWLQYNAWTAWNNRSESGITGTQWAVKTKDSDRTSAWSASAAVALYQNTPSSTVLIKDAYHTIEAEDFNSCSTIITGGATEGGKYVGGIKDGAYTVYRKVDFGSTAPGSAEFKVLPLGEGGTIEIRTGGIEGEVVGSLEVKKTEASREWSTQRVNLTGNLTGLQDIYLIYHSEQEDPFYLNSFRFLTGAEQLVESVAIDKQSPVYRDVLNAVISPVNAEASYIWKADGVQVAAGKTYEVAEAVIGKKLTVTAIGEGAFGGTAVSAETDEVADLPPDQMRNPYERIEAESADLLAGPGIEGNYIAGIQNGHYAVYKNMLFGEKGSTFVSFCYATPMGDASVEIREGSAEGKLLGVCELPGTGGWNNWNTAECDISDAIGRQDIYLVFKAGSYVCNLDYFSFLEEDTAARNPYEKVEAESADVVSGAAIEAQYLTGIKNDSYAVYKNVRFGEKGATKVNLRYATPMEDASVEIRLGSIDGPVIGTGELAGTGDWNNWAEVSFTVTGAVGRQDIWLVFKGGDEVCSLDYFAFTELAGEIRNPYTNIEAEYYDGVKGCGTETRDGVTYLAGIRTGYYSAYYNMDFGETGASKVTLRYASPVSDAYIEIRSGGTDGRLLGTCNLQNTGDFWKFTDTTYDIEPVNGLQDIYLVYYGTYDICNFDRMVFGQ